MALALIRSAHGITRTDSQPAGSAVGAGLAGAVQAEPARCRQRRRSNHTAGKMIKPARYQGKLCCCCTKRRGSLSAGPGRARAALALVLRPVGRLALAAAAGQAKEGERMGFKLSRSARVQSTSTPHPPCPHLTCSTPPGGTDCTCADPAPACRSRRSGAVPSEEDYASWHQTRLQRCAVRRSWTAEGHLAQQ